jgi:putative transposase
MPDHLHFLARIAPGETISGTVGAFKWRVSMATKVRWQRQWFDHRVRDERQQLQLERYIRENPVRAGLVDVAEKWPYVFRKAPGKVG